jgi:hypothetical protein
MTTKQEPGTLSLPHRQRVRAEHHSSQCAGWFAGLHQGLSTLDFVRNAEARSVLSHHNGTQITTEAAGTVHLALNVRVGSLSGAGRMSSADGAQEVPVRHNPAQARAEDMLLSRLEALSQSHSSPLSGLELVRKVVHLTCVWMGRREPVAGAQQLFCCPSPPRKTAFASSRHLTCPTHYHLRTFCIWCTGCNLDVPCHCFCREKLTT